MAQKGNLMTVRTDVKVLDATIRDGGLVNGFYFTDEFVNELYRTNVKAGVDYMEFGYKASKDMFDVNKFGKWKFCDEDDIRAIVGDNNSDLKISVMADVGRCDYKKDIIDRKDSVIDMVRVATYINTMPAAIHMIEDAKEKGYEVTCNIMAISNAQEADLDTALKMLAETNVDGVSGGQLRFSLPGADPRSFRQICGCNGCSRQICRNPCTQQPAACFCQYD